MNKKILIGILIIILAVGFLIRFNGLFFGFPMPQIAHPDEPHLVNRALNIIKTGNLNPNFFNYPSLMIYILSIFYFIIIKFSEIFSVHIDFRTFYITGRFITLLFSMGTIFINYKIIKLFFNRITAVIGTIFVTFSFLHVSNSFLITVDSPMAFWVILSFYFSALIYSGKISLKYYILNGIFIGLAVGTKYTAFISFFPFVFAHFHQKKYSFKDILEKKFVIAALIVPIVFILTTPFSLLNFNKWEVITPNLFALFTKDILIQISIILDYLHLHDLVHCDLKLNNFMIKKKQRERSDIKPGKTPRRHDA